MDEEFLATRRHDAALVDDRVLLQRALEVVAECPIRLGGAQVLPVRLNEQTVPDLEVGDFVVDLDHADDRLVSGDRRLRAGPIVRDVGEGIKADSPLY